MWAGAVHEIDSRIIMFEKECKVKSYNRYETYRNTHKLDHLLKYSLISAGFTLMPYSALCVQFKVSIAHPEDKFSGL